MPCHERLSIVIIVLQVVFSGSFAKDIIWTWISGNGDVDQPVSESYPGSRSGSSVWKEDNTSVWLFGGEVYNSSRNSRQFTNDLWLYNITSNRWKLINSGNNNNAPAKRKLATVCGIKKEALFVYGGFSENSVLNDMWFYIFHESKWLPLSAINNKSSTTPGARGDMASWCLNDKLIIFGGESENQKLHNDMWSFSLVNLIWSEVGSSSKLPETQIGMAALSYPKARSGAITWKNGTELLMFGGKIKALTEMNENEQDAYSSDLWLYLQHDDSWKLMNGFEVPGHPGIYGNLRIASEFNIPGSRRGGGGFADKNGAVWFFGGEGSDAASKSSVNKLSDLWLYNRTKWTWMGGYKTGNQTGKLIYTKEIPNGYIGSRSDFVYWEVENALFVFGGAGFDSKGNYGLLGDLVKIDLQHFICTDNSLSLGSTLMMVFFGIGLTSLAFVLLMSSRSQTKEANFVETKTKEEYSKLLSDDQDFS